MFVFFAWDGLFWAGINALTSWPLTTIMKSDFGLGSRFDWHILAGQIDMDSANILK